MKSTLLSVFSFLVFTGAASAEIKIPKGYEPILQCAATSETPELAVARDADGLMVLAAKVGRKTELFKLDVTGGDCGYSTYEPVDVESWGDLAQHVGRVYVYNNDEEVEDHADAIITGGSIWVTGRDDQECEAVGSPVLVLQ